VRAGWAVKSKVLDVVQISFLLILDYRFEECDKEVFISPCQRQYTPWYFILLWFIRTSGIIDRLKSRIYAATNAEECHKGHARRERYEKKPSEGGIYFGGDLKSAIKLLVVGQTLLEIWLHNFFMSTSVL